MVCSIWTCIALHSDVAYIEVWHARFFEFVPESPGDDVHRDVVSDDSTDAGQGGLDRTERGHQSVRFLRLHKAPPEPHDAVFTG